MTGSAIPSKSKTRRIVALLAVMVAAVALVACGGSHSSHSDSSAGNSADASFVASMIPHHESAVAMAKLAGTRAEHPQLKQLAATIISSQDAEIATMKNLQPDLPKAGGGHDGHMGMSSAEMGMDGDMGTLEKANPFDKAFLEMMIPHHEGAIRMARSELVNGKNPQLKDLSRSIIASQGKEIAQMRAWLKAWYGATPTS